MHLQFGESPARNAFERELKKELTRKKNWGRVLDAGCKRKPYRNWFACTEYVGLDKEKFPETDVVGDAHRLPFPDASFDTVFSANLYYTLEDPEQALKEARRVLRKGGTFLGNFPFQNPLLLDEEEDKNRFTPYRISQLFKDWKKIQLMPCGGLFTQLGQSWFRWSERKPGPLRLLLFPVRWTWNLLALLAAPNQDYAPNFLVVAEK